MPEVVEGAESLENGGAGRGERVWVDGMGWVGVLVRGGKE